MPRPKKDRGGRVSQAEAGRIFGIDPSIITNTWKPRFSENDWPGFYDNGVDLGEFHAGMLRWERMKSAKKSSEATGVLDAKERWEESRADKAQLELQAMRSQMIYIPDFADEIVNMQTAYRQAQSRLPRTMAPNLINWIAVKLAEDIKRNPEISIALEKIKVGELETWLDQQNSRAVGDMGRELDKAWRNAISRAKIKAS